MDDGAEHIAVAGRTGFAHYSIASRKWRLFGNETQEKDFIVTGGILWWREHVVMGKEQIRIYKLDPRTKQSEASFFLQAGIKKNILAILSATCSKIVPWQASSLGAFSKLIWTPNLMLTFELAGCYNLAALYDEIRVYPRTEKLDNSFAKIVKVDAQVLLLNLLNDSLVVFCADNIITTYGLSLTASAIPSN